ncbi:acyl-CoA dehydrogenase family protein [Chloroflexota bacterium]
MDFELTDEQKILARTGREFTKRFIPKTLVRELEDDPTGFRQEVWAEMALLGWTGWIIPEEYGGVGGSYPDLIALFEELGRACYLGPFSSSIICTMAILKYGNEKQKREFLPKVASGEAIFVLAQSEPVAQTDRDVAQVKATRVSGGWTIEGTKLFVPYAHIANWFVCTAQTSEGIALFLVDAKSTDLSYKLLETLARDKQCEVSFNSVKVPEENVLGEAGKGWEIVKNLNQWGALTQCALISGVVQQVLEMSVEYAKERVQFNQPIGSFQVIQHKCADMMADVEAVKYLTYLAAWKMNTGQSAKLEISMAKARASDASRRVCLGGHAVHGGIGITADHDMQIYFRQAKTMELAFGNADFHRELVAQHLEL